MQGKIVESNRQTQSIGDTPKNQVWNKEFFTVNDAAVVLGSSSKAIHLMITSGKLKAINLGIRKTRVLRSEIQRLFELPTLVVKPVPKVKLEEEPLTKANCYTVEDITTSLGVTRDSVYSMVNRKKNLNFNRRQLEVQSQRFGFLSSRMMNGDFITFFETEKERRKGTNRVLLH